jgi:hypothetical protein
MGRCGKTERRRKDFTTEARRSTEGTEKDEERREEKRREEKKKKEKQREGPDLGLRTFRESADGNRERVNRRPGRLMPGEFRCLQKRTGNSGWMRTTDGDLGTKTRNSS